MAFDNNQIRETLQAAADLSGKQYHLLRLSAAEVCNQASNSADSAAIGVLHNKPGSGEAASVTFFGMSKVTAGGSLGVGALFTTNGSGRATAATSGSYVYGRTLEATTADGDIFTGWIDRPWKFSG